MARITESAAIDLESKFTESALGRIQLSDFRNFGHGRHHWVAKRNRESAVLALCSPGDVGLAKKTLGCLPKNFPRIIANFPQAFPDRSIAAIVYVMTVAGTAGDIKGIDPGKPGVPDFGRRIYHIKATGKGQGVRDALMACPLRRKFATLGPSSKTAATLHALSGRVRTRRIQAKRKRPSSRSGGDRRLSRVTNTLRSTLASSVRYLAVEENC